MKETYGEKSMTLEDFTMYLKDLVKRGFALEYTSDNGKLNYKLSDLGKQSGLTDIPNSN